MNKQRRMQLRQISFALTTVKTKEELYDWIDELENIKSDEEYSYDRIPENLHYSIIAE